MRKALAVSIVCLLLPLSGFTSVAQKSKTKLDLNELRSRLSKALAERATIVRDELNEPNGSANAGSYWLVYIQPKNTGHYSIKYRYNYNGTLYSHVERDLRFRVGETGCRRVPMGHGHYAKFCIGDTIILPIAVENFTEHEFSLKFTDEDVSDPALYESLKPTIQPFNPAASQLAYIGVRSELASIHGGGYTLQHLAVFEAKEPGRFNLALSNYPITGSTSGGYPVIVIEKNTPITALLASEHVEGFSKGFNGQEYSSSSGSNTSYLTDVLVIQTGDRFTFEFGSEKHSADDERNERNETTVDRRIEHPPYIAKLPFSFDKNWGYNGWIREWVMK